MAKVIWSEAAKNDLKKIRNYIALDKPVTADLYARRIFRATKRLGKFPKFGRVVPEGSNPNLREIIFGNYRIIYELKAERIEILTIHHSAHLLHLG